MDKFVYTGEEGRKRKAEELHEDESKDGAKPDSPPLKLPRQRKGGAGLNTHRHIKTLTDKQREAYNMACRGHNLFLSGRAGTGKSFLLHHILRVLYKKHPGGVFVTASTGIAACHIRGTTLHRFSGVGMGKGSYAAIRTRVLRSKQAVKRWGKAKTLIVDEISMVPAALWDVLDRLGRELRGCDAPFGGIQVLAVGDFLQLPPINAKFAFQSEVWDTMFPPERTVRLTTMHRQAGDAAFRAILEQVRVGALPEDMHKQLLGAGSSIPAMVAEGIVPTRLFSLNRKVDAHNATQLQALHEKLGVPLHTWGAVDTGTKEYKEQLSQNCRAPKTLSLCIGAQVMLLKNLDVRRGLANGTRGVVLNIMTEEGKRVPLIRFFTAKRGFVDSAVGPDVWTIEVNGEVKATRVQVPLTLAWAISIHKSQGMTISALHVDLRNCFADGQAYVALSRGTSLDTMVVEPFDRQVVHADADVLRFEGIET